MRATALSRTLRYPHVLSLAGSDSGGGAGIRADPKTFAALGCFGMTAITAITAHNTTGVRAIHGVPPVVLALVGAVVGEFVGASRGLGALINVSSDLFVVREDTYQKRKDTLRRFLRAYRDAAAWTIAQPQEAAQLAQRRAIDGSDAALNLEIVQARNASTVSERTRREGLGALDVASLQKAADVCRQLGLAQQRLDMAAVVAADLPPGKVA